MVNVSNRELGLVEGRIEVRQVDSITLFIRPELSLDPSQFISLLTEDRPGETYQPGKGRFVLKFLPAEVGPVVSKRFHDHRTYRRKQRWFMGYRWQKAHGITQFVRALYTSSRGHRVVEPLLALRRNTGFLRQESLLVTRAVEGVSLRDLFLDPGHPWEEKLELFQRGIHALKAMHEDGISFGDAQTRHQILDKEDRIWWLDFDKMAVDGAGRHRVDRDLRRFVSSTLMRMKQSGHDLDRSRQAVMEVLEETYPLPSIWRGILHLEVKKRVRRMLKKASR